MGPKARSIFHRGLSMGLEVDYKAVVGNDSIFLEPIHPLYDINMDVAAQVSYGEEGVFINHLVGNVLDMDPHILEVGHQVIEVVVDDVCGGVAVPFVGIGDDGVKADIEVQ